MSMDSGYSGRLIAFEGLENETRQRALGAARDRLEAHGRRVLVTRWMSSALAGEVYRQAAPLYELSPRTLALLAACDIAERMEWDILPALQRGDIVLADRYVYRVVLAAARDVDPDWLEVLCGAGPEPDLVLCVPASEAAHRKKHETGLLNLYEAGMDIGMTHDLPLSYRFYEERLAEAYLEWADLHSLEIRDVPTPAAAGDAVAKLLDLPAAGIDRRYLAVVRLLEESDSDSSHARQVARLAAELFELTAKLHRLDEEAQQLLRFACLLHDIGGLSLGAERPIRSARHVRESNLEGFGQTELTALAVLIGIHRVTDDHSEVESWYRSLPPDLQRSVSLLGPLLRLAEGLDATRRQSVRALTATIHEGVFDLRLQAKEKVKSEIKAAVQRVDLFEQAYGLRLLIDSTRKGPPPAGANLVSPSGRPWHERRQP
jgi:thymidylate kinase